MTGQMLWLALTAQGHEVLLEECEGLAKYVGYGVPGELWVSTTKGRYTYDPRSTFDNGLGDMFPLVHNGEVQQVDRRLFKRGWDRMRALGELP